MSGSQNPTHTLAETRLLAQRLERLSADSSWARRASGVRGGLLRALDSLENGITPPGLGGLLEHARHILIQAAREIPAHEQINPPGKGFQDQDE